MVYDDDEHLVGYIICNENARQFDAHCLRHGERTCCIGRTCREHESRTGAPLTAKQLSQGRPLAFLIAWLRYGATDQFIDGPAGRDEHFKARKCQGDHAWLASGSDPRRMSARTWVESAGEFVGIRTEERQPRDDEPLEPLGGF